MAAPQDFHKMMENTNPYASPRSNVESLEPEAFELELADRGTRLGANLLDGLISGIPAIALIWLTLAFFGYGLLAPLRGTGRLLLSLSAIVIGGGLYFAINSFLLARYGQTVGKRICQIRIARLDGGAPTLWDFFGKRYLPILLVSQIPVVGSLFCLIEVLFIFRENRLCLHDHIAGTMVVKAGRVRQPAPKASPVSAPVREFPKEEISPEVTVKEEALPAPIPPNLEICPYCAELTSGDTNTCRGCGRNPFIVDSQTANRSLTVEELLRKANKLSGYGLSYRQEALDVHVFATLKFPLSKDAWLGLQNAPNADPAMKQEARLQLEKIERVLWGDSVV